MPTGYTYKITEDKDLTFQEFARQCATGFGACIHLRDETIDYTKPLPHQEVSDYHVKSLKDAEEKLSNYIKCTEEELLEKYNKYVEKKKSERIELKENNSEKLFAYNKFLNMVEEWESPSSDHDKLKLFMVEQIKKSVDWDCASNDRQAGVYANNDDYQTFKKWKQTFLKTCEHNIEFHKEGLKKEKENVRKANEWIDVFEDSLK